MTPIRRALYALPLTSAGTALIAAAVGWTVLHSASHGKSEPEDTQHRPIEVAADGYISSRECRACHQQQYESWQASYHRTMTQVATPQSVRAPLDRSHFTRWGHDYAVKQRGDEFWVDSAGIDAERSAHRIALVTGSHAMQVYWYETGEKRRLAALPFAYLIDQARFIPRDAAFLRPPGPGRPTDTGRWNTTCIDCHTTDGRPRVDAAGTTDTNVGELGIACEACHGPGAEHVAHNAVPWRRYQGRLDGKPDTTIVNPKTLSHRRVSEMCGHCHGNWQFRTDDDYQKWMSSGFEYRPGDDPQLTQVLFQPSLRDKEPLVAQIMQSMPTLVQGSFWPDGMSRVSGREYNGLYGSPCYKHGEMSCLSCHEMHKRSDDARPSNEWADDQLGVGMRGNQACLQCHKQFAAKLTEHTGHALNSEGSLCYNCHMPHTTYGLLKAIRSHQVSSPNVAKDAGAGRPNACNLCHLDKTLAWTAEQLQRRYGIPAPTLGDDQRKYAASVLSSLTGDAGERALLAWAMAWPPARHASDPTAMLPLLGVLLDDPYDAVRLVAERSLRAYPAFEHFKYDAVPSPDTRPWVAPSVWSAVPRTAGRPRPELLRTAAGTFDEQAAAQLRKRRDDRPVNLFE